MTKEAIIFGPTKYDTELTPIVSSASICSVIRMLPISEAMLLPIFPAKIKLTMVDENSNSIVSRVK